LVIKVLRWTRFYHDHSTGDIKKKDFFENLPASLQRDLVTLIFGDVLMRIPIFEW